MVTAAALNENSHGIKGKGSDGISTVLAITQEEAQVIYKEQLRKNNMLDEDNEDDNAGMAQDSDNDDQAADGNDSDAGDMNRMKYTTTKKKKAALQNDFYKFQMKDYKKQKLEELRTGFEEDRRRLQKMMQKKQDKQQKLLKQNQ